MMSAIANTKTQAIQIAVDELMEGRKALTTTVSGSALYGTATEASDDDLRVVFLPSKEEILTGKVSFGLDGNLENKRLGVGDVDVGGVSLMRYLGLIGRMDMIYTEILFASGMPEFSFGPVDPIFKEIFEKRDKLLAGNSNAAIGHARQRIGAFFPSDDQSLDAVRAVHDIFERLLSKGVTRIIDFPEALAEIAAIDNVEVITSPRDQHKQRRYWKDLTDAERLSGVADNQHLMVQVSGKKIGVTNPLDASVKVVRRPLDREDEKKRIRLHGDKVVWKDAYQGVRLVYQAIELHRTRELVFPRPEAKTLRSIRAGEISTEALTDIIAELMNELRDVEAKYPFPEEPCPDAQVEIICKAHEMIVRQ
jgi:hypothetical protein